MQNLPRLDVLIELLHSDAQLPTRAHQTDACFDLRAAEAASLEPGQTCLVGLGWAMQLEEGWEARIRGRSGLASRGIAAHHGTIDHLYRQEVKVILHNLSGELFQVEIGDRVAQLAFAPVYPVNLSGGQIELTARGGFGSTGMK
jgi:dUTP diphosphatase